MQYYQRHLSTLQLDSKTDFGGGTSTAIGLVQSMSLLTNRTYIGPTDDLRWIW